MNKKIVFVFLLTIVGLSGIIIYTSNTYIAKKIILKAIAEEFSKKYNKSPDAFILTLDSDSGAFAKGSATFKAEGDGGLWFAAMENGVWKLVYDGNGIISCSDLELYPDFPSGLIPQCFDNNQNMLINR